MPTLQEYLQNLRATGTLSPAPLQPVPVSPNTAPVAPPSPGGSPGIPPRQVFPPRTAPISAPQPVPRQIPGATPVQPFAGPRDGFLGPQPRPTPAPAPVQQVSGPTGAIFGPAPPTVRQGGISAPQPQPRQILGPAPATPVAPTRAPQGTIAGEHAAPFLPTPGLTPTPPLRPGGTISGEHAAPFLPTPGVPPTVPPPSPPSAPTTEPPSQINIGNIIRRLMAMTPRQYYGLLPSQRQTLASVVSQLGVPPEDFFRSVERQFPSGVNPGRIAFGANF